MNAYESLATLVDSALEAPSRTTEDDSKLVILRGSGPMSLWCTDYKGELGLALSRPGRR